MSVRHETAGNVVVRCDGRLSAETLPDLQALLGAHEANPKAPTAIDLSGVTALDDVGRSFLINQRSRGCRLFGGSLYVNSLLQESAV